MSIMCTKLVFIIFIYLKDSIYVIMKFIIIINDHKNYNKIEIISRELIMHTDIRTQFIIAPLMDKQVVIVTIIILSL